MPTIIDARVRLPLECRPPEARELPSEYAVHYDRVLNLSASRHRTLDELRRDMAGASIDHAIVHAEYEFGDGADAMNVAVGKLVADDPETFSGFGTISMERFTIMRAVRQVVDCAENGLVGVNFQPSFFGVAIDDRRFYAVYAKAAELGLTVAVHTGINYSAIHPIKNDHPLQIDQVACDFSELRIIACHSGWPWVAQMVAVARKHPNVYMDFGGLAPKYVGVPGSGWEVMYRFMNSLLTDQILFATDWPVFPMERAISEWSDLDLKPDVLERLLGGNARRLLAEPPV